MNLFSPLKRSLFCEIKIRDKKLLNRIEKKNFNFKKKI